MIYHTAYIRITPSLTLTFESTRLKCVGQRRVLFFFGGGTGLINCFRMLPVAPLHGSMVN